MRGAEIAERETVQVPTMSGIAKRTEIRVMRRNNEHLAAGSRKAVKLLHRANHVGDMLDDVNRPDFVERIVAERIGKMIEFAQNIRLDARNAIDSDRAWIFVDAAADVEHAWRKVGHSRG